MATSAVIHDPFGLGYQWSYNFVQTILSLNIVDGENLHYFNLMFAFQTFYRMCRAHLFQYHKLESLLISGSGNIFRGVKFAARKKKKKEKINIPTFFETTIGPLREFFFPLSHIDDYWKLFDNRHKKPTFKS